MHGPGAEFKGDAAIDAIFLWGQAKACLIGAAKVDLTGKPTGIGDFGQGHGGLCHQSTCTIQTNVAIILHRTAPRSVQKGDPFEVVRYWPLVQPRRLARAFPNFVP